MGFGELFKTSETPAVEIEQPAVNTEVVEAPAVENIETPAAEVETPVVETPTVEQPVTELVFDESSVLNQINAKYGKQFQSFDEVLAEKVVEKVVNPYENVSEEAQQFLKFNAETGRGLKDWEFLNTDFTAVDPLIFARERVRKESGLELTNEEADTYIENELGIDLSEIDSVTKIKLNSYGKPVRDEKISLKETYKTPIAPKQVEASEEVVQLDNGAVMKKVEYEQMVQNHQKHVAEVKESANRVATSTFKVSFDDNGVQKEFELTYEKSPEDVQSMASDASDPAAAAQRILRSESGFNTEGLNENMFWFNPKTREKAITSLIQKAIAKNTEEILKRDNNVNFQTPDLLKPDSTVRYVPVTPQTQTAGFGQLFNQKN